MGDWSVRTTRPDEIARVHAFYAAEHRKRTGREFPLSLETLVHLSTAPGRDPELDLLTIEHDGTIVGRAVIVANPPYSEVLAYPVVHSTLSEAETTEAHRLVVERLEVAARARIGGDASGEHAVGVDVLDGDAKVEHALTSLGFALARRSYEMGMDLDPAFPRPEPPPGVTVRAWNRERDTDAVVTIITEAFTDHHGDAGGPENVAHFLESEDIRHDLTFLAVDDDGPMGVVVSMDRAGAGYVSSLGVLRRARGRGVGRALLLTSLAGFAATGATRAGLDVDAENLSGATRLYESVGLRPEIVYALWLRPLAP